MLIKPKKKKLIRIIIIILSLVETLVDNDDLNSPQERVARLIGQAEGLMNGWDIEANWTSPQSDLWNLIDAIHTATDPEAIETPDTSDYESWENSLTEKLGAL